MRSNADCKTQKNEQGKVEISSTKRHETTHILSVKINK